MIKSPTSSEKEFNKARDDSRILQSRKGQRTSEKQVRNKCKLETKKHHKELNQVSKNTQLLIQLIFSHIQDFGIKKRFIGTCNFHRPQQSKETIPNYVHVEEMN